MNTTDFKQRHTQIKQAMQHHQHISDQYQNINHSMIILAVALFIAIVMQMSIFQICLMILIYIIGCLIIMSYHEIKFRQLFKTLKNFENQSSHHPKEE